MARRVDSCAHCESGEIHDSQAGKCRTWAVTCDASADGLGKIYVPIYAFVRSSSDGTVTTYALTNPRLRNLAEESRKCRLFSSAIDLLNLRSCAHLTEGS